jgi:hypothetical protein
MIKTGEQLKSELYAPLPSEAIKPHPTKTFLSTIKPIYVTDRLNEVFGIGGWQLKTENILVNDNGTVVNKVIFIVPEYDIYYECFGGNDNGGQTSKGFDLGDAFKGATTDGLTKICSYLGIGIDVFRGKQYAKVSTPPPVYNTSIPVKSPTDIPAPIPNTSIPKQDTLTDEAIAKAEKLLNNLIPDVKYLLLKQKDFKATPEGANFQSSACVVDVVKNNHPDLVNGFYKFVKKK